MEATTAAVEAPATTKSTAMEAASAHAASVSTATTSVTAAATTTTTSECGSWLSLALAGLARPPFPVIYRL